MYKAVGRGYILRKGIVSRAFLTAMWSASRMTGKESSPFFVVSFQSGVIDSSSPHSVPKFYLISNPQAIGVSFKIYNNL